MDWLEKVCGDHGEHRAWPFGRDGVAVAGMDMGMCIEGIGIDWGGRK